MHRQYVHTVQNGCDVLERKWYKNLLSLKILYMCHIYEWNLILDQYIRSKTTRAGCLCYNFIYWIVLHLIYFYRKIRKYFMLWKPAIFRLHINWFLSSWRWEQETKTKYIYNVFNNNVGMTNRISKKPWVPSQNCIRRTKSLN